MVMMMMRETTISLMRRAPKRFLGVIFMMGRPGFYISLWWKLIRSLADADG
jgi:hypothetical protein